MKIFTVLYLCIAGTLCESMQEDDMSAIASLRERSALKQEEVRDELGQFSLSYETAEGIMVSERGRLIPNKEGTGQVLITEGEFSYIGDDGKTYATKYSAGLGGYVVESSPNSPQAPVVPAQEQVPSV